MGQGDPTPHARRGEGRDPGRLYSRSALLGLVALVGAALSAGLLAGLGHDAWAWMVWAREIAHLDLDTTTGSTIKPLPMLLMAPLGPIGDLAPYTWLTLSRAAWLLIPVVAWQLGKRLDGPRAGGFAAVCCLMIPVLFDSAVNGYSESLTALALLMAIVALSGERPNAALALVAVAGLMRPEAWPFALALAIHGVKTNRIRPAVGLIGGFGPPAAWAALSWWGSGAPFGGASGTESIRAAGSVFAPFATGMAPFALLGLLTALVLAARERNRPVLLMIGVSAAWVTLVAVLVQLGFSGNDRYLVPSQVVAAVAAGWGLAKACELLPGATAPRVATGFVGLLLAVSLLPTVRSAHGSVSRFSANARTASGMKEAVALAGGRARVLATGEPVVMNWSRRTALAWQLDVPIGGTQVIWGPNWTGSLTLPAILLASPPREGNARAPLPTNIDLKRLGRAGQWSVYRAERPRAGGPVSSAQARTAAR